MALLTARGRKLAFWAIGLVLAYTLVGFLVLPPIVRAVAVKQLGQQLGREVSIQSVRLNPYVLSATVRGLLIKDLDGQPFISWDEVYANVQLSSVFVHPWVLKELSTTRPYVRVQINKDYSFNFSDLVSRFSTNAAPKEPGKPLAVRIEKFRIAGARAALRDLTPHQPFERVLGPVDVTLVDFRTDPANKNPYSVAGTTDAGEKFSWSGYFYLDPLRSQGDFSLENLSLNKYAGLYQDLVRFQVSDGVVDAQASYHFELSGSNHIAWVTNTSFRLRSFKLAEGASRAGVVELPELKVTGVSADAQARRADVGSVWAADARLGLRRDKDNSINLMEMAKPAEGAGAASGGVLLLLRAMTNAAALFLNSTNAWGGTVEEVKFQNCALELEDLANSRPVRLNLDQIDFAAHHLSNLPGTNLSASLSLRWNTNGTVKSQVQATLAPLAAEVELNLEKVELRALDPYLESKLNVFVLGSKLSLNGRARMLATNTALPEVSFEGDARLEDFSTVDGALAEDLLKWDSVRVSGIQARLNPEQVSIREVAVDNAFARVIIDTNRTVNLLTALRLSQTNATAAASAGAGDAQKGLRSPAPSRAGATASGAGAASPITGLPAGLPRVQVASVVISNAEVRFTDRSVRPAVNMAIEQAGGTLSGLSTEAAGHAALDLHARIDKVGPVAVTGFINPLNPNATNELRVTVTNVDLTPTSPYVGKFAGYRLFEGKVNMELSYHWQGRQLKSENVIVLDRFTFGDKVNSPEATKLPVRLAVAILKDRQGKITLDVPIEGSLDDPKFRLHKVIVGAIENLLTKIVTSPFAALGAVFGGHGEEMSYQDFPAGSAELPTAGREKLEALVKGLYERPALQLELSGSVEPEADREGLRRAALEKRLRTAKWMSLRKSERATMRPEQVSVSPEERDHWLKRVFEEAVAQGQVSAHPEATNQAGQGTGTVEARAALTSAPSAESNPSFQHGATALMQGVQVGGLASTLAVGAAKPSKAAVAETRETALLQSIPMTDGELRELASQRAQAVRDFLVQSGKVEAGRVFLAEAPSDGVKSQGSRAYLQLR